MRCSALCTTLSRSGFLARIYLLFPGLVKMAVSKNQLAVLAVVVVQTHDLFDYVAELPVKSTIDEDVDVLVNILK